MVLGVLECRSGVLFCSDGGTGHDISDPETESPKSCRTSPAATLGWRDNSNGEQNANANARSPQVEDPLRNRQYFKQAVASDDYSFTAQADGKYNYCFSNEGWTSNSKEVSFNVHGIVYVPEHEMAQDPLEVEGKRGEQQPTAEYWD